MSKTLKLYSFADWSAKVVVITFGSSNVIPSQYNACVLVTKLVSQFVPGAAMMFSIESSCIAIEVPPFVKVGDKVLIPKMGAQTITLEGEEYYITAQNSILSIIE